MFKKFFNIAVVLVLALAIAGCGGEETKKDTAKAVEQKSGSNKVQIGILSNYAPFSFQENGQFKGINYEMAKEAFKRMGVEVEFKVFPWQRMLEMAKNGELDGVMDASYNAERAEFLNYPQEPTSVDFIYFYALPDSSISYGGSMDAIKGKKIAAMRGYSFGDAFTKARKDNLFTVEEGDNFEGNYLKLMEKRVDLMVEYKTLFEYEMKKAGKSVSAVKQLTPPVVSDDKQFLVFSKKSSRANQEFIQKFSAALQEIRKDGTYQKIYNSYTK